MQTTAMSGEEYEDHGVVTANNKQKKLNRNAQWLILENETVNRIKCEVHYANAFLLRSFKLLLQMERHT